MFADAGRVYYLDLSRTGVSAHESKRPAAFTLACSHLGIHPCGAQLQSEEERHGGPRVAILSEGYCRGVRRRPAHLNRGLQLNGELYSMWAYAQVFQFPNDVTRCGLPLTFQPKQLEPRARPISCGCTRAWRPGSIRESFRASRATSSQVSLEHPANIRWTGRAGDSLSADGEGRRRARCALVVHPFWRRELSVTIVCPTWPDCAGAFDGTAVRGLFAHGVEPPVPDCAASATEVLLLALAGGVAGLLLARTGVYLLAKYGPGPAQLETPVFWFGLALSLAAGIACGLYPAWIATRCRR